MKKVFMILSSVLFLGGNSMFAQSLKAESAVKDTKCSLG